VSVIVVALLGAGGFFLLVSTVGLLRLPDFYSRSHAAGKSETLGSILVLGAMALHHGFEHASLKVLVILALVAVSSPAAVHALTRAAVRSGVEFWSRSREAGP
jgi:multicomponent Na+:H+ antiporter subunit G